MIKNAITYSVEMPSAEEMEGFAIEFLSKKPGTYQLSTIGFSRHSVTDSVVSKFDGGYCLCITEWIKKLDRSAINSEVNERVDSIQLNQQRKVSRKEKDQLKIEIVAELIPLILPSKKVTYAYYHSESKTLIVDTPTGSTADNVTSLLRKAIGSLLATSLYIDSSVGLTQSLKNHLEHDDEFIDGLITLGDSLELQSKESKVKFKDLDLTDPSTSSEIIEQISGGGMFIKSVSLGFSFVDFELSSDFKLKKIKFDIDSDHDDENQEEIWQAETIIGVNNIACITSQLVKRFKVVES